MDVHFFVSIRVKFIFRVKEKEKFEYKRRDATSFQV